MPVTYTNKPTRSVGDSGVTSDFNDLDTAMGQARDSITSLEAAPPAHTHPVTDLSATGTRSSTTYLRGDGTWATPPAGDGTGVTDHGALTGLADDDHGQYHTDARGDARYYTKAGSDARHPVVVEHGGTAGTVRPAVTSVLWIGTVTPTNMTANDLYLGPA